MKARYSWLLRILSVLVLGIGSLACGTAVNSQQTTNVENGPGNLNADTGIKYTVYNADTTNPDACTNWHSQIDVFGEGYSIVTSNNSSPHYKFDLDPNSYDTYGDIDTDEKRVKVETAFEITVFRSTLDESTAYRYDRVLLMCSIAKTEVPLVPEPTKPTPEN